MKRKGAAHRPKGKRKSGLGTSSRRPLFSATADTLPIAPDRGTTRGTIEARLSKVAEGMFRNMGED